MPDTFRTLLVIGQKRHSLGSFQEDYLEEVTSDSLRSLTTYRENRAEGAKRQEITLAEVRIQRPADET